MRKIPKTNNKSNATQLTCQPRKTENRETFSQRMQFVYYRYTIKRYEIILFEVR